VAPAVHVFEESGGAFAEAARFTSVKRYFDNQAEHLGYAVAKRGDVIVAGDPSLPFWYYGPEWMGTPITEVGGAFLIEREDGEWVARHYLRPSELNLDPNYGEGGGGDIWGNAVATDGRAAFYSSPMRGDDEEGSIHHFEPEWEGPGPWPGCYCSGYGVSQYGPCTPYGYCLPYIGVEPGVGPLVTKIETPDLRTIVVTFEREMEDNADLVDPRAYVLTGGARVTSVIRLNATQVRLRTNRKLRNRRPYLLTVRANPGGS
jgi:hypothetical protein